MDVSTPALLFPAISLLFLAYTNRFLHLAALIRSLHSEYLKDGGDHIRKQIENLRIRLLLIRWMQLLGAASLLCCVIAMVSILASAQSLGQAFFIIALLTMGGSLAALLAEISKSGGALKILLEEVDREKV